jgi:TRAP-type mannitol/chloroaromatic compound transport system substrate-binding protein
VRRRTFLTGLAGTAAATGLAASAVAQATPTVRWRLTSSFPRSLDTIDRAAEVFAKGLAAATDGGFQMQVFAPGEIVPGLAALDAASNGTVECAHTNSFLYVGKNEAFAFGTAIPFGLNARQQNAWMLEGGGGGGAARLPARGARRLLRRGLHRLWRDRRAATRTSGRSTSPGSPYGPRRRSGSSSPSSASTPT